MTTARETLLGVTGAQIRALQDDTFATQMAGTVTSTSQSWLDFEREEYTRMAERWQLTLDAYTGDIVDPDRVALYLVRRSQGESTDAYIERCGLADWPGHMATMIDSLAGMLSHQEEDTTRVLNDGDTKVLGDVNDRDSHFGRLWQNADGRGTGWNTLHKQLAVQLTLLGKVWGFVDRAENKDPTLRYISPLCVPDWVPGPSGLPVEVKLVERVDIRTTVRDQPMKVKRWVLYALDGWKRYEKSSTASGQVEEKLVDEGRYDFYSSDTGERQLPIFPVELPLGRDVGWLLAKRWVAHFNMLSALDQLLRVANFPKLNLVASGEDDARKLVWFMKEGWNTLWNLPNQGFHAYIAPPTQSADVALKVLQDRVQDIYISGFQSYGDAAAQKTATEVNQDAESGVAAFLQMLVAGVDEGENTGLRLITQLIHPAKPKWWSIPHVQRSNKFTPRDADAIVQNTINRVFGKDMVVPLGADARLAAAKQIAEYTGLEIDEAQVKAETELRGILDTIEKATMAQLPMPSAVRVQLALKLWGAFGLIDAEKLVELEDGTKVKFLDVVAKEMEALTAAQDEAKLREAEATPAPAPVPFPAGA